jgi:hypothetical protein
MRRTNKGIALLKCGNGSNYFSNNTYDYFWKQEHRTIVLCVSMNVDFYDNVKEPITCIHILFVGRLVGNDSLRNT